MDFYHVLAKCFYLTTLKQILDMYRNDGLNFVYIPILVRERE